MDGYMQFNCVLFIAVIIITVNLIITNVKFTRLLTIVELNQLNKNSSIHDLNQNIVNVANEVKGLSDRIIYDNKITQDKLNSIGHDVKGNNVKPEIVQLNDMIIGNRHLMNDSFRKLDDDINKLEPGPRPITPQPGPQPSPQPGPGPGPPPKPEPWSGSMSTKLCKYLLMSSMTIIVMLNM